MPNDAIQPLDPSQFQEIGTPSGSASQPMPAEVQQSQQGAQSAVGSLAQASPPPASQPAPPASIAAPAPQASQPAAAQPQPLDASQFTQLPAYADGSSPLTPITKSPLTIDERMKLSVGNEKGQMDYLKSKFRDVTKDKDGNIVVQDRNGAWSMIHGDTFGDVDAWQATKGIAKTVASIPLGLVAPQFTEDMVKNDPVASEVYGKLADHTAILGATALTALAAPVAAAAAAGMTTAAALGINAAAMGTSGILSKGISTSLGRLEGTYEADPMQQVGDIAFEGLLNAGGVYVAAGIKPTAALIGDNLPQFAKNMGSMPGSAIDTFKDMYGKIALGPGGGAHIDEVINNTGTVQEMMKLGEAAGQGEKGFQQAIFNDKIDTVKEAAQTGKRLMAGLFSKMQDQLVNAVPKNFSGDMSEVTNGVFGQLADKGLVALKIGDQTLSAVEAKELMDSGKSIAQGAKWVLKPQAELLEQFRAGGLDVADQALVKQSHESLGTLVDTMNAVGGSQPIRGADGVRMLMKSTQVLDDVTYQLAQEGKDAAVNSIPRLMADMHQQIRQGVTDQFEKYGAGQAYTALNDSYSTVRRPLTQLFAAVDRANKTGMDNVLETFVNKLSAKSPSQATKSAFEAIPQLAEQYGMTNSAKEFAGHGARLRAADAALAFNPMLRPGLSSTSAVGAVVGLAATGHVIPAAGVAAGMAATSPQVAYQATLMAKGLMQSKAYIATLGGDGVRRMAQNPALMTAFSRSVMQLPVVQQNVTNQLSQHAMQTVHSVIGGGGGQQ